MVKFNSGSLSTGGFSDGVILSGEMINQHIHFINGADTDYYPRFSLCADSPNTASGNTVNVWSNDYGVPVKCFSASVTNAAWEMTAVDNTTGLTVASGTYIPIGSQVRLNSTVSSSNPHGMISLILSGGTFGGN